jgi:hypothetical protein
MKNCTISASFLPQKKRCPLFSRILPLAQALCEAFARILPGRLRVASAAESENRKPNINMGQRKVCRPGLSGRSCVKSERHTKRNR